MLTKRVSLWTVGIVDSSIKRGMHIEALERVYTFGMEERFSASSILTSFLRAEREIV